MVMGPVMKTASMKPEVALLDNDELTGVEVVGCLVSMLMLYISRKRTSKVLCNLVHFCVDIQNMRSSITLFLSCVHFDLSG